MSYTIFISPESKCENDDDVTDMSTFFIIFDANLRIFLIIITGYLKFLNVYGLTFSAYLQSSVFLFLIRGEDYLSYFSFCNSFSHKIADFGG